MSDASTPSTQRRRLQSGTTRRGAVGCAVRRGPSPELAALSRSTHFDWRLAPLRHRRVARPRQGAAPRPGLLDRRRAHESIVPSTSLAAASPTATLARPVRRGRARRARAAADRRDRCRGRRPAAGRPVPQRPDRDAVPAPSCSTTRRGSRALRRSTWSRRCRIRRAATST